MANKKDAALLLTKSLYPNRGFIMEKDKFTFVLLNKKQVDIHKSVAKSSFGPVVGNMGVIPVHSTFIGNKELGRFIKLLYYQDLESLTWTLDDMCAIQALCEAFNNVKVPKFLKVKGVDLKAQVKRIKDELTDGMKTLGLAIVGAPGMNNSLFTGMNTGLAIAGPPGMNEDDDLFTRMPRIWSAKTNSGSGLLAGDPWNHVMGPAPPPANSGSGSGLLNKKRKCIAPEEPVPIKVETVVIDDSEEDSDIDLDFD